MLYSLDAVDDADVADLYAGSGGLGIEALSRGARTVAFVESDRRNAALIDKNLAAVDLDGGTVVAGTVDAFVAGARGPFDLVFVDPPYALAPWATLLPALAHSLADEAVVVCESDAEVELPSGWQKLRVKSYGSTVITFARGPEAHPPTQE